MHEPSIKRKSDLIHELINHGIGVRRARKAVNAFFDSIIRAVRRGECVDIPGGTITATTRQGTRRCKMQCVRNVNTGNDRPKILHFRGRRKVVKFKPDEALDLTPLPEPLTPEEIKCRELASELLGRKVDERSMALLQSAADFPAPKPGRLLRRLRECQNRGWTTASLDRLAADIKSLALVRGM